MPPSATRPPLAYHLAAEQPPPDEAAAIAAIDASMHAILQTTWADYGHAVRSVHAKSHGLLQGELQVLEGLPDSLAQGVFASPRSYPVVLRISTNPGDILDDTVSAPRGLAIKLIGVEGERLPGSEGNATQDFVMANSPAFVAPDARAFSASLKLLAATTDTGQAWKKALSSVLRSLAGAAAALGVDGAAVRALGGQPLTHPLGETFYTQTPFRHGRHIAKLSVAPVSANLIALKDAPVPLAGRPNGLRGAVIDFFRSQGAEWELRVQLRTNPGGMPVEDAAVRWSEAESPYIAVARITVPPQPAWNEARAQQVDDAMAFSPWHGIAAHQPLGSLNRARKQAYALSAGFRASHNRCPIHQPQTAPVLSREGAAVFGVTPGREGHRPHTPDALPGKLGQPLNATARGITAGVIGGVAAGALLSGIFLAVELASGEPSDLVKLQRRAAGKAGIAKVGIVKAGIVKAGIVKLGIVKVGGVKARLAGVRETRPSAPGEQLGAHGGHLALSAAAGLAYGAAKPATVSPLLAGTVFGAGFYALAYGALGPMLGVTPRLSRDSTASIVQHGLFHVLFGVTMAVVADRAAQRL